MSVTTTANVRILTSANYLSDYALHHSQPIPSEASPAPAPNAQDSSSTTNPADWETQWRRVPPHRPVRNQLDEMRNTYTSEVERNFVRVMLGGVYMMASVSQIWRATGGRLNSEIFKHKIGGEW